MIWKLYIYIYNIDYRKYRISSPLIRPTHFFVTTIIIKRGGHYSHMVLTLWLRQVQGPRHLNIEM